MPNAPPPLGKYQTVRYGYFPESSGTPAPKRQRVAQTPFTMARSTPRLGKFAKRVVRGRRRSSKGKRASLANKVATIAKIQKADHKVLSKSQEYADFSASLSLNPPNLRVWGSYALIDPLNWTETLRRSNHTATSAECKLLNMRVALQLYHPPTTAQQLTWTFMFVSGKADYTGTPRASVDYLAQGYGMPLIFNRNNIKIHKKFVIRTKAAAAGDPISLSVPQRSFTMNLGRWLRRTPTTNTTAEHNWKKLVAADFNMQEQIHMLVYVDATDNTQWTVLPSYTMFATFAVSQM